MPGRISLCVHVSVPHHGWIWGFWGGGGLCAHALFGLSWQRALLSPCNLCVAGGFLLIVKIVQGNSEILFFLYNAVLNKKKIVEQRHPFIIAGWDGEKWEQVGC